MAAVRKTISQAKHPVRQTTAALDIKELCARTAKQYPKILAELAK